MYSDPAFQAFIKSHCFPTIEEGQCMGRLQSSNQSLTEMMRPGSRKFDPRLQTTPRSLEMVIVICMSGSRKMSPWVCELRLRDELDSARRDRRDRENVNVIFPSSQYLPVISKLKQFMHAGAFADDCSFHCISCLVIFSSTSCFCPTPEIPWTLEIEVAADNWN